uniref:Uncharacterized protein n=1 Tax=Mus musculus TaxID=10090 RepID=Q3TQL6_MOUSE|nr:unnamed protein product [Mus musculus]
MSRRPPCPGPQDPGDWRARQCLRRTEGASPAAAARGLVRWRPCRRFHLAWPVGRVSHLRHGCGGRRRRPPFCGICWENLGPIRTEPVGTRNLARNESDRALP